tara:strand:- start:125 stop:517 length:393 start_codon:yes stop_codon:yes gene_type:complete
MERDYAYGKLKEQERQDKLEKYLGVSFNKKTPRYCFYDFAGGGKYLEHKERKSCLSTTFPTTMVGYDKIQKAIASGISDNMYFSFGYEDALYVWKFNADEYSVKTMGRWDRGRDERKPYALIKFADMVAV